MVPERRWGVVKPWTPAEARLLRYLASTIAPVLTAPEAAHSCWREATRSGGGWGLTYRFGKTALEGEWRTYQTPDAGRLLESSRITYNRILRWAENLPAETREQARFLDRAQGFRSGYRTWLFYELIGDPSPEDPGRIGPPTKPRRRPIRDDVHLPPHPDDHPADLLELLEMTA